MKCPGDDAEAKENFSEMTSAAGKAYSAEDKAKKKIQEVHGQEKVLLETVAEGLMLSTDGMKEFVNLVEEAFKACKDAKRHYQMYGTTCLNIIGLGRKLPLVKFERKMMSGEIVKCKFCERTFQHFAAMSEHMLRAHCEELGLEFEEEVNSETIENCDSVADGEGDRLTNSESKRNSDIAADGKGDRLTNSESKGNSDIAADGQGDRLICKVCKKRFNNVAECESHQNICSGVPEHPKCPRCQKVFGSKNAYKKHRPTSCKGQSCYVNMEEKKDV